MWEVWLHTIGCSTWMHICGLPNLHTVLLGLHLPLVSRALCILDASFCDCQTFTHVHCASWMHFFVTAQLAHICRTTWLPPVICVSLCTVRPGRIFWWLPNLHTSASPLGFHLSSMSPCALCVLDAFFGDCPTRTHLPHHLASTCHLCLSLCTVRPGRIFWWLPNLHTPQWFEPPPATCLSLCTVRPGRIFWWPLNLHLSAYHWPSRLLPVIHLSSCAVHWDPFSGDSSAHTHLHSSASRPLHAYRVSCAAVYPSRMHNLLQCTTPSIQWHTHMHPGHIIPYQAHVPYCVSSWIIQGQNTHSTCNTFILFNSTSIHGRQPRPAYIDLTINSWQFMGVPDQPIEILEVRPTIVAVLCGVPCTWHVYFFAPSSLCVQSAHLL